MIPGFEPNRNVSDSCDDEFVNPETPDIAAARTIATIAHRGQTDKLGADYISHPERVAYSLTNPLEVATAWLHDVIEDCGISAPDLLKAGISAPVVEAVELLTRRPDIPSADYYAAIRQNPIALAVKKADIVDNTLDWRLEQLPDETRKRLAAKYEKALAALG